MLTKNKWYVESVCATEQHNHLQTHTLQQDEGEHEGPAQ